MTKIVGILGYPLKHSLSPLFQQVAFDYYGLDVRYETWEVEAHGVPAVVASLRGADYLGMNVTIPYKERVIPLLDELSPEAKEIGAVNTVVNRGGWLIGYNTDTQGFLRALREDGGMDPKGKIALLVGVGGAARAVGYALRNGEAKRLILVNRTYQRAARLTADLSAMGHSESIVMALPRGERTLARVVADCHLVVNCTSVGMRYSPTEDRSPLEGIPIPKGTLICDLVYNPFETPLLAQAKAAGARTLGGLPMLIYQGAEAFALWIGREAPVEAMMRAAKEALTRDAAGL